MSHHGGGHHGHHGGGGFHSIFIIVAAIIVTGVVVTFALQACLIVGVFLVAASWWLFRSLVCLLVLAVGWCMRPAEVSAIWRKAMAERRRRPPFVPTARPRHARAAGHRRHH